MGNGWPPELRINAWAGSKPATSVVREAAAGSWALGEHATVLDHMLFADEPADQRDWEDPAVGWGLILADNDQAPAVKIAAEDAPDPIQELRAQRQEAPVFRYDAALGDAYLRVYREGFEPYSIATAGSNVGTGPEQLPQYLLIVGSPDEIPWSLQYTLNTTRFVGRLDLEEEGLRRYVAALLTGWAGTDIKSEHPVLWSDDLGSDDITWLMRHTIAADIKELLEKDATVATPVVHLVKERATMANLRDALERGKPALVVSTSHGWTPPSIDAVVAADKKRLGALVDHAGYLATAADLLGGQWQPNGAVWYAHACCSAGADSTTDYAGVIDAGSEIDKTLRAATSWGALTAELPRRLLSAEKPLGAFVGQVEPTFNWTLQDSVIGQVMTGGLNKALYEGLFRRRPEPIGMAMRSVFASVGTHWQNWRSAKKRAVAEGDVLARAIAAQAQLAAIDRQSTVILGDPTVTVPAMAGQSR